MKKFILKFFFITSIILVLALTYLSTIGFETNKFNNQITKEIYKSNNKFEVKLKKIKLTLDPINFEVKAKTIGTRILYNDKILPLEYIKTNISISSLIKKRFSSAKFEISTRSMQLKDLATIIRAISNKPEFFLLEKSIKKGQAIIKINLNLDDSGKIKQDYKINAILKDTKIKLYKNYNFEKINFLLNANNNSFNFQDFSFSINKTSFFLKELNITKNRKNYLVEGDIQNENSILNDDLLKLFNLNLKNLKISNTNYNSKNIFSFHIDRKFKIKDLDINSNLFINSLDYKRPYFFNNYLYNKEDVIQIKDHKIKLTFKKNSLSVDGLGKIELENKLNDIEYRINFKDDKFKLTSNLNINELKLDKQKKLKSFLPELNEAIILKNQKIKIQYTNDDLSIKGEGKIKLEKEFEKINFNILKTKNEINFDTNLDLKKTILNINFLNFKRKDEQKTKIYLSGSYNFNKSINLKKLSIIDKSDKIILEDLLINENQIENLKKLDLEFFDNQNKKNIILLTKINKNNYKISGSKFNANKLIDNLLKNKKNSDTNIFKNDSKLIFNLDEVYLDDIHFVKNFKGNLVFKDNKIFSTELLADFNKTDTLKFTIKTNTNGEKISTLFSSRAKPIVSRYKFIKGYEEGYLDFYSSKKDGVSKSKIKIYDFKLQELPALTKLLTLASLQGIADTLSGEGIRFNEFEMNFTNKANLMTVDEIYAIGPAISILMSGYIEEDKLVSLRGTLVPATTLNKTIGSIPFLGKILVGDKTGEGVFGVSFKIKGSPDNLETSVNPIKTLTPRFITRTLEKIKNN